MMENALAEYHVDRPIRHRQVEQIALHESARIAYLVEALLRDEHSVGNVGADIRMLAQMITEKKHCAEPSPAAGIEDRLASSGKPLGQSRRIPVTVTLEQPLARRRAHGLRFVGVALRPLEGEGGFGLSLSVRSLSRVAHHSALGSKYSSSTLLPSTRTRPTIRQVDPYAMELSGRSLFTTE